MGYKKCQPDPKYPQYFRMRPDGNLGYFGLKGTLFVLGGNSCKVLDAKPGTAIVHQDLFVERESARIVRIQDAEGRPLSRAWATNLRPDESDPVRLKGDSCPVYSLEADKPRFMVFYEPNKRLAAWLKLTTGAEEPIAVRLRPAGAFRGRLLDTDGKPLAGVVVDVRYRDGSAGEIHRIIHKAKQSVTDANGTFSLDELIPELKFELVFRGGKRRFERETKPTEAMIQVESAECRDLGAIKLKRIPETVGE